MMPVRRSQNWLPSIFNDFFDNELMAKANATAPAINVIETDNEMFLTRYYHTVKQLEYVEFLHDPVDCVAPVRQPIQFESGLL